ncbi:27415_t:CDS:2, partial [Dentiscutata erythropus]
QQLRLMCKDPPPPFYIIVSEERYRCHLKGSLLRKKELKKFEFWHR